MAGILSRCTRFAVVLPRVFGASARSATSYVNTEQKGKVLVVSIARPEKRNAINSETADQLSETFRHFEIDDSVNVAVLTGKGGNFCAGSDLQELAQKDAETYMKSFYPPGEGDGPMGPTRLKLTKPVIGAIQGYAVGGGLELALLCDLRVCEEDSVFGFFNRRFGVPLVDGGAVRLPYLIGLSRALDLIMTGRAVKAQEAIEIGLVNRVVPKGKAIEEAIKIAEKISRFPQESLKADRKTAFYSTFNADSFYDALTYEYRKGVKIPIVRDAIAGAQQFQQGMGKKGSFDEW
ncbi:predicted protein [Nematostella vectensis]|uniref:Uncharacterized protein n=1 Tax=Nematostella vectensis TaxID=45351 RepID=A7SWZ6_NEMVE|nr:2,3-dehydroadipyl-CoA hydratase [Nematostella vectensis]EDO31779.1 predicted protein [Nematostella vectensis]|eukprot:XP_001623879.1 predicted protein [Nematostella vectensis]